MESYPNLKPLKPGQSGDLDGRPVLRLAQASRVILAEVWAEKASVLHTAEKQPLCSLARVRG